MYVSVVVYVYIRVYMCIVCKCYVSILVSVYVYLCVYVYVYGCGNGITVYWMTDIVIGEKIAITNVLQHLVRPRTSTIVEVRIGPGPVPPLGHPTIPDRTLKTISLKTTTILGLQTVVPSTSFPPLGTCVRTQVNFRTGGS